MSVQGLLRVGPIPLTYPTVHCQELAELQKKFVVVLTQLEILLPLYCNTSTRHFLLHIVDCVTRIGHFWSFSMLGVERIHITIKKLARYTQCLYICRKPSHRDGLTPVPLV